MHISLHRLMTMRQIIANRQAQRMPTPRAIWIVPRPQEWWDHMDRTLDQKTWKEHFRINRDTFDMLVHLLGPHIERQPTHFREVMSSIKFALNLWVYVMHVPFKNPFVVIYLTITI